MAVTATRNATLSWTGDITASVTLNQSTNLVSNPALQEYNLTTGTNTITVPTAGSVVPQCATIQAPAGNQVALTVKGIAGDTGVRIHNSDPCHLSLDPSVTSFVINAGSNVTGLKIYWT